MKMPLLMIVLLSVPAFSDQAAVIPKKPADRAAAILNNAKSVTHYCAPCEDGKAGREAVKDVSVKPWDGRKNPGDFMVYLNGKDIDLAYVYVERAGSWMNLARLVNIEVADVPTVLDNPPRKTEIFTLP